MEGPIPAPCGSRGPSEVAQRIDGHVLLPLVTKIVLRLSPRMHKQGPDLHLERNWGFFDFLPCLGFEIRRNMEDAVITFVPEGVVCFGLLPDFLERCEVLLEGCDHNVNVVEEENQDSTSHLIFDLS